MIAILFAYLAGVASCLVALVVIGRRTGRTGPNSRVTTREAVSATLITPAKHRS